MPKTARVATKIRAAEEVRGPGKRSSILQLSKTMKYNLARKLNKIKDVTGREDLGEA
jgi:hypothetical protein